MVRKRIVAGRPGPVRGLPLARRPERHRLGLTGWVCNREDGTVEMEVQGGRRRWTPSSARGRPRSPLCRGDPYRGGGQKPDPDERSFPCAGGHRRRVKSGEKRQNRFTFILHSVRISAK